MRRLLTSTPLPAALGLVVASPVPLSANLLRQHLLVLEHDWDYPLVPSHSDGIDGSSAAVADGTAVPDAACAGALPLCTRSPGGCGWLHALHLRLLHVRVDLLCHACCPCRADSLGRVHSRRPSGGGVPVSPYQFLSGYDPDAPISPATPGICAALLNALSLGDKILYLLTSTASSSPGIASDKGNLLQTAISIFGAQTGFSPVIQDVMVLAKIADKVFKQFQTASGCSTPAPNQQPGVVPPPAPLLRQPLRLSPSR